MLTSWIEDRHTLHNCVAMNETFDILGHDSALQGYPGPMTTYANEMNFGMNHG